MTLPDPPIRILVADDHTLLRHGIRQVLDGQPDLRVVGEAAHLDQLLASLATPADVLLLDLSMPGASGAELVEAVRRVAPTIGIVILTMYPEDQLALHLLERGANAYLSKTRTPAEIMAAIRAVARGDRYLTDTLAEMSGAGGAQESTRLPHERLSAREYQVFILLLQGKAPAEIATTLQVGPSTISTYLAGIRQKLGVANASEVVLYGHRAGLLG